MARSINERINSGPVVYDSNVGSIVAAGTVSQAVKPQAHDLGKTFDTTRLHAKSNGDLGRRINTGSISDAPVYRITENVSPEIIKMVAIASGKSLEQTTKEYIIVKNSTDYEEIIKGITEKPLLQNGNFFYRPFVGLGSATEIANHFQGKDGFSCEYKNNPQMNLARNSKSFFREVCGSDGLNILVNGKTFSLTDETATDQIKKYTKDKTKFFKFDQTFSSAGNGIINKDGTFETKNDDGTSAVFDSFSTYYDEHISHRKEHAGKAVIEDILEVDDALSCSYGFYIHEDKSVERLTPTIQKFKKGFYHGNHITNDSLIFPNSLTINNAMREMGNKILKESMKKSIEEFGDFYTGDGNVDFTLLRPTPHNIQTLQTKGILCQYVTYAGQNYILYPFEINARQGGGTYAGYLDKATHERNIIDGGHFTASSKATPSKRFLSKIRKAYDTKGQHNNGNYHAEKQVAQYLLNKKHNFSVEDKRTGFAGIAASGPSGEMNYVLVARDYKEHLKRTAEIERLLGNKTIANAIQYYGQELWDSIANNSKVHN